jgi:hypothetical protein
MLQSIARTHNNRPDRPRDDGAARVRVTREDAAPRLTDVLHVLRMAALKETKDPMWKGEHYLVFLDRLERLGQAALSSGRMRQSRWTSTRRLA